MVLLVAHLDQQVAAYGGDQRHEALLDQPLDVEAENERAQKLEQVERHAFHPVYFFIHERLVACFLLPTLSIGFLIVILVAVAPVLSSERLDRLVVRDNLSEDWQVGVEEFPGRLEYQVDGFLRKVDQVSEDDNEALEGVLFEIEVLLWIRLDQL